MIYSTVEAQLLINALTGQVGPGTNLFGNPWLSELYGKRESEGSQIVRVEEPISIGHAAFQARSSIRPTSEERSLAHAARDFACRLRLRSRPHFGLGSNPARGAILCVFANLGRTLL